jgi:lysophospholipase L1-like esterase
MGLGGTGFVRTNGERPAYASRLPALLSKDAGTVVIQATGNDAICDLASVEAATRDFLTVATGRFPRVIVVGPMWAKDGAGNLPALRDLTARVCADLGIPFIDALGWLSPRLIGPDGAHPTKLGHAVIAAKLAAAIRRLR